MLETALEQMETEDNFNELALAAIGQTETQRLEMLRHQATEAANLQNGKDTAMLDWQTGSDPLKAAAKIDHLLKAGGAEYILMGHMACGIANLRILKDADNWKKEVMELLRTMECEYAQEHGCGRIKWDLLTHLSPLWAEKWKMMKLEKDPEKILNPTII